MNKYRITYKQGPTCETEITIFKGYSAEHAEERFLDSMEEDGGTEGLEILSVHQVTIKNGIVKMV